MIRGLIGIVPAREMQVGRFYMEPGDQDGNRLFQCVQTNEPYEDTFRQKALVLTTAGRPEIRLRELPYVTPVLALGDVHVRVDPTSLHKSAFDAFPHRGMFLVREGEPIICAPSDQYRGWAAVNLNSGRTLPTDLGSSWLTFTRWSLVMDDEKGDELTLVEFENGAEAP